MIACGVWKTKKGADGSWPAAVRGVYGMRGNPHGRRVRQWESVPRLPKFMGKDQTDATDEGASTA
jgi:hypothetical protein